jgi:hypothetical protein
MTPEQQKRAEEYREKIRQERARKKHMTTEEFYEQMAQSMGMKLKFIKKKEDEYLQTLQR